MCDFYETFRIYSEKCLPNIDNHLSQCHDSFGRGAFLKEILHLIYLGNNFCCWLYQTSKLNNSYLLNYSNSELKEIFIKRCRFLLIFRITGDFSETYGVYRIKCLLNMISISTDLLCWFEKDQFLKELAHLTRTIYFDRHLLILQKLR